MEKELEKYIKEKVNIEKEILGMDNNPIDTNISAEENQYILQEKLENINIEIDNILYDLNKKEKEEIKKKIYNKLNSENFDILNNNNDKFILLIVYSDKHNSNNVYITTLEEINKNKKSQVFIDLYKFHNHNEDIKISTASFNKNIIEVETFVDIDSLIKNYKRYSILLDNNINEDILEKIKINYRQYSKNSNVNKKNKNKLIK